MQCKCFIVVDQGVPLLSCTKSERLLTKTEHLVFIHYFGRFDIDDDVNGCACHI